jgi:HK97 family phage major capsid protein
LRSASEAEYRAMTSGASSGGSLVPPSYLTEQYAPFRSYVPAVADSCTSMQLPPYGLTIDVPANLGGVSVTAQSAENTDVGESDFTGVYRSVPLSTMSGYTTISQQLLDRSGPTKFDEVVYAQARDALDAQIDLLVINAMLGVATTNLTRSSFTDMSSLWSDANHAASTIETTAGTLLPATHLFLPPRNFRWFASQVDSSKRPIWTPDGDSSPDPQTGFTGYRIGGTGVFTDGSLPTVGTSNLPTFLVANPASTLLFQGEPIVGAFIEPNAASLEVIVRLYAYAAPVVRYPSAAASISGSAYPGSPSWA